MKRSLLFLLLALSINTAAFAATFTVTNTNDSGAGSLRAAIDSANAAQDADVINFAIPASDPGCDSVTNVCTIEPNTNLPTLTAPVAINGYSQTGASANTLAVGTNAVLTVEIAGTDSGTGLLITGSNCLIEGIVINGFTNGIVIAAPPTNVAAPNGIFLATGNHVEGCFIGTNPDGATVSIRNQIGVLIQSAAQANVIGGQSVAARNLISGNSGQGIVIRDSSTVNNQVLNNLIGTTRTGLIALGNSTGVQISNGAASNAIGVQFASQQVSGALTSVTNVISGNSYGVVLAADDNIVRNNFIGTNATGAVALPNELIGIDVRGSMNNSIESNVISGNGQQGIYLNGNFGETDGNIVNLNRIGVGVNDEPVGNGGQGVLIGPMNAANNQIGGATKGSPLGNVVANNGGVGVDLGTGGGVTGNLISLNSIYNNTGLGIGMPTTNDDCDEDDGPNTGQNFPVLTSVTSTSSGTHIVGTLNTESDSTFRIEFFANPTCDATGFGEGRTYLGSVTVTTDLECHADIDFTTDVGDLSGQVIAATATSGSNNTSGFSACLLVPGGATTVQFSSATYNVNEGAGSVTLTVTRTGDNSGINTVNYATGDVTAMAGADYTETAGSLTFAPGDTSKTINVPILDDSTVEGTETFTVTLSEGGSPEKSPDLAPGIIGVPSVATVTIDDNDAAPTPTPSPSPTPATVQLLNISGRAFSQTSEKVAICGFIISGGANKRVIVRGIGPSLEHATPVISDAMQDPMIELHRGDGSVMTTNDNWRSSQESQIQQSGLAPSDNREAAIIANLEPGAYTAVLRGANNSAGIGLVEVYDLDQFNGQFANVSIRGFASTDDNVLINGVILRGATPRSFVFRALGPSLHNQNISGELQDPMLQVYNEQGVQIGNNDNWQQSPDAVAIEAAGLAPSDTRESALLLTLPPANYTTIIRGVNRTTGVALAEAYKLEMVEGPPTKQ